MMDKNNLVLAYLGDAVFELYIRDYLVRNTNYKVNDIQKKVTSIVSAKGQNDILKKIYNDNILSHLELEIINRGRNHKKNSHPKNTDIITYKYATGFEALIGYLYLNDIKRLEEIIEHILKDIKL